MKHRPKGETQMSPPAREGTSLRIPQPEFEAMLARAAEEGAKRALADAGLDGKEAALDIRDLRLLLDCIRFVRRTAVQTTVHLVTTGIILAMLAGVALKLKLFGSGP
jgi:hypothetical protein